MKKNVTMCAALLAALTLGAMASCTKENNLENDAPSIISAYIPDEISKVSLKTTIFALSLQLAVPGTNFLPSRAALLQIMPSLKEIP